LKANLLPACVEACPKQATIFSERSALLAEAHRRLRAAPGTYVQRVYGENEVGGTSVLYISDVPLDFLSYTNNLTEKPLPDLTWVAMASVPPAAFGVMALMAGTYWVIKRRMQLMGNPVEPQNENTK
jgi:formate dehydrogenase iron-sulfur subunit